MVGYLAWRTTIINEDALVLSLVYFAAETLGFVLGLTLIFSSWRYRHREPPPAPRDRSVDVFVTTYKESVELVRLTLIGAREIAYPHQTFLLDDGNRPEMRALAAEIGVRYLARGDNLHAKAGNLNFGLAHSTGEFVMVFDADHIALPHALDTTLGFFREAAVAMVQTPQDYYNIDAFQYFNARNGGIWHDQSFFYQIAQACRDAFNGASCVGTSVLYRRSALDAIGGIPTETVTEDIHTSLKLHKAGFEVVYLNEPIAYGVAAADIRDYYRTRHRWAHGNIHALRIENVLFCRELTLGQRLSYLTLGLIYLEGWQQLLLFIVPLLSLFLGWAPFDITVFNVLVVLLFPILTMLLLQELGCGLSRYWVNEVFSVARFPIHLAAALALFVGRMPFRTSIKNIRGRIDWGLLSPQIGVGVLSLAALISGVVHLALNFQVGPLGLAFRQMSRGNFGDIDWSARLDQGYTLELVIVAGFWALFNAAKSFYLVRKAVVDARNSHDDYRFDAPLLAEFSTPSGRWLVAIDRVSRSFFSAPVAAQDAPPCGEKLIGIIYLPSGPLPIECVVRACVPLDAAKRPNAVMLECDLVWRSERSRDRLARSIYSVDWHREFMHRNRFFSTPLDALGRLLRLRSPLTPRQPGWRPALYREDFAPPGYAVIRSDGATASIVAFHSLAPESVLDFETPGERGNEALRVRIIESEPLNSLATKGLDGATVHRYRGRIESKLGTISAPLAIAAE